MLTRGITYVLLVSVSVIAIFYCLLFILKKWSGKKKRFFPHLIQKQLHASGILLCLTIIGNILISTFDNYIPGRSLSITKHVFEIVIIMAIGFFILKVVRVVYEILIHYYSARDTVDYSLRRARTKFQMIQRMLNIVVTISTVIAILVTFPEVRNFGNTLLASAGVAGIILGFAAQKSIGTLFSGIQIALAQPVKLDDIVVVDDQFGTVGEITLTYIVVNTWDEKRLIVPINYFLENCFENWTRVSPEVMGMVKIYTDYSLPIAEIRAKFNEWIAESPLWDKRKSSFLVTGSTDKTIEVRATMSAKDSDDAFDLECIIREKLIEYIKENHPNSLPAERIRYREVTEQGKPENPPDA